MSCRTSSKTIVAVVNTVARELLSLIVPPLCCVCREPEFSGSALCVDCRSRLVALAGPRCLRCGAPLLHNADDCRECRGRELAFERAWAPFAYAGVARKVIGALKSRGAVSLGGFMAHEIAARVPEGFLEGTLVPVPAHARRRRKHGFNQAGSIVTSLGRDASLPVSDLLTRSTTARQVGLERRARLANTSRSVRLRRRREVPLQVVLVDDVYTTGATLDACARALAEAGSEKIVAVTFARAIRSAGVCGARA